MEQMATLGVVKQSVPMLEPFLHGQEGRDAE
jgi:hypothetical protein